MPNFAKIVIKEQSHPQDFSRIFLCQFAVDGVPCVPFYSHVIDRQRLGEEGWLRSLYENAEQLVRDYGRAPALT